MSRAAKVTLGDGSPTRAAAELGLNLAQFEHCKHSLFDRGFPHPDPTTGNYDLDAITVWRRARFPRLFPLSPTLTATDKPRDAREKLGA